MLGRFQYKNIVFSGEIFDDVVYPDPVYQQLDDEYPLSSLLILPPVLPTKIVCAGLNYADHAKELNMELPTSPLLFLKPPSAILPHEGLIQYPPESEQVDYEAELGIVIGKTCRHVSVADAFDYILGYTCFNDVTARDLQRADGQWTRSKSFDTFAPLGPFIVTQEELSQQNLTPENLSVQCRVIRNENEEVRQNSSTSEFIFGIPKLVSFISSVMTLEKGDIIATGTPPGVGELLIGDVVEVEIEGVGILRNTVVSA
ncbi:MAG: fumarylacetoacetate hydrolase family protein [Methanosarcinales archaeon]|jgi:2-keto-4-pentenoate hydratase/2-oxohepta-3-ene-1,7-dioic acid hydratase in catechol pathway|nr:fumarylacetoacetate hydrolase family protein [Methanosarcinales archaeon]